MFIGLAFPGNKGFLRGSDGGPEVGRRSVESLSKNAHLRPEPPGQPSISSPKSSRRGPRRRRKDWGRQSRAKSTSTTVLNASGDLQLRVQAQDEDSQEDRRE